MMENHDDAYKDDHHDELPVDGGTDTDVFGTTHRPPPPPSDSPPQPFHRSRFNGLRQPSPQQRDRRRRRRRRRRQQRDTYGIFGSDHSSSSSSSCSSSSSEDDEYIHNHSNNNELNDKEDEDDSSKSSHDSSRSSVENDSTTNKKKIIMKRTCNHNNQTTTNHRHNSSRHKAKKEKKKKNGSSSFVWMQENTGNNNTSTAPQPHDSSRRTRTRTLKSASSAPTFVRSRDRDHDHNHDPWQVEEEEVVDGDGEGKDDHTTAAEAMMDPNDINDHDEEDHHKKNTPRLSSDHPQRQDAIASSFNDDEGRRGDLPPPQEDPPHEPLLQQQQLQQEQDRRDEANQRFWDLLHQGGRGAPPAPQGQRSSEKRRTMSHHPTNYTQAAHTMSRDTQGTTTNTPPLPPPPPPTTGTTTLLPVLLPPPPPPAWEKHTKGFGSRLLAKMAASAASSASGVAAHSRHNPTTTSHHDFSTTHPPPPHYTATASAVASAHSSLIAVKLRPTNLGLGYGGFREAHHHHHHHHSQPQQQKYTTIPHDNAQAAASNSAAQRSATASTSPTSIPSTRALLAQESWRRRRRPRRIRSATHNTMMSVIDLTGAPVVRPQDKEEEEEKEEEKVVVELGEELLHNVTLLLHQYQAQHASTGHSVASTRLDCDRLAAHQAAVQTQQDTMRARHTKLQQLQALLDQSKSILQIQPLPIITTSGGENHNDPWIHNIQTQVAPALLAMVHLFTRAEASELQLHTVVIPSMVVGPILDRYIETIWLASLLQIKEDSSGDNGNKNKNNDHVRMTQNECEPAADVKEQNSKSAATTSDYRMVEKATAITESMLQVVAALARAMADASPAPAIADTASFAVVPPSHDHHDPPPPPPLRLASALRTLIQKHVIPRVQQLLECNHTFWNPPCHNDRTLLVYETLCYQLVAWQDQCDRDLGESTSTSKNNVPNPRRHSGNGAATDTTTTTTTTTTAMTMEDAHQVFPAGEVASDNDDDDGDVEMHEERHEDEKEHLLHVKERPEQQYYLQHLGHGRRADTAIRLLDLVQVLDDALMKTLARSIQRWSPQLTCTTIMPAASAQASGHDTYTKSPEWIHRLDLWVMVWFPHLSAASLAVVVAECKQTLSSTLTYANQTIAEHNNGDKKKKDSHNDNDSDNTILFLERCRQVLQPWRGVFKLATIHSWVSKHVLPRWLRAFTPNNTEILTDTALEWHAASLLPNVELLSLLETVALPIYVRNVYDGLERARSSIMKASASSSSSSSSLSVLSTKQQHQQHPQSNHQTQLLPLREAVITSYREWKRRLAPFLRNDLYLCAWLHAVLLMVRAVGTTTVSKNALLDDSESDDWNVLRPPPALYSFLVLGSSNTRLLRSRYAEIGARRAASEKQQAAADWLRAMHRHDADPAEVEARIRAMAAAQPSGTATSTRTDTAAANHHRHHHTGTVTFRDVIATFAADHGVLFQPKEQEQRSSRVHVDGHDVYRFGSQLIYWDGNVIFRYHKKNQNQNQNHKQWTPTSLSDLLEQALT